MPGEALCRFVIFLKKIFLVIGITKNSPNISVRKPGNINKKAPITKAAPDIISNIGISFFTSWLIADLRVLNPSYLT